VKAACAGWPQKVMLFGSGGDGWRHSTSWGRSLAGSLARWLAGRLPGLTRADIASSAALRSFPERSAPLVHARHSCLIAAQYLFRPHLSSQGSAGANVRLSVCRGPFS
jgi:hypothetical protein